MKYDKQIEVCGMIQKDMEKDMKALEGIPFTGGNVAEAFGKQAAAISMLAEMLGKLMINVDTGS